MSRTYRRKHGPISKWATHDWILNEDWTWTRVPFPERELVKNLAKYHSDAGYASYYSANPDKWFRNTQERKQRMYNRCELARFYRNFDYEVMAEAKKKLPYWD